MTGPASGGEPRLATGLVLASILLVATVPLAGGASAQTGTPMTIVPEEGVFEPEEPIRLVVWNNGSTPRQGIPTVEIHHCPTAGLCAAGEEQVHEWTGSETRLVPGENLTVTWDRLADDGSPTAEGTYEAHLDWNGTADTPDETADSRRFEIRNGTVDADPQAPAIETIRPTDGELIAGPDLDYRFKITGKSDLELVSVSLDGRVVDERTDPGRETVVEGTVDVTPGSHVLSVVAHDDQDRVNRTLVRFALAPPTAASGIDYAAMPDGGLTDVHADDGTIFESVVPQQEDTPISGTARLGSLVVSSTTEATLVHRLPADATLTEHTAGFAVQGPDGDRRAIVIADRDRARAMDGELVVDLRPDEELVIRPVRDTPADRAIAQAILDRRVVAEVHVDAAGEATVLSYDAVTAETTAQPDRVQVDVTAPGPTGRAVVVTLAEDAPVGDELRVSLDGVELAPADGLADALDPSEGTPEAHVVDEDGTRRVAVSVDHFSTRSVVIETAEAVGQFLTPGALIGAGAIVTLAAWGLFRRPEA